MKYYLYRLFHNQNFKMVFILLFIFMNIDLLILNYQMSDYHPDFSTFLAGGSLGHFMQMLVLWLLPIYLLLGESSWFIHDEKTRNSFILTTKFGKRKYIKLYLLNVFLSTFLLFFINFLINYVFAYIVNYGELYSSLGGDDYGFRDLGIQLKNPILFNIIYMFTTSFFFSVYAVFLSCVSFVFNKISYVLLFGFSIWLIFISGNYSIMLACQPFCEYSFAYQGKIYFICLLIIIIPSIALYHYKVKKDEL